MWSEVACASCCSVHLLPETLLGLRGLALFWTIESVNQFTGCRHYFVVISRILLLQLLILRFLLPIHHHPIRAKHHVQEQPNREHSYCGGRQPAAERIKLIQPRLEFRA